MKLKFQWFILFFMMTCVAFSQQASVTVESLNSNQLFYLSINNQVINKQPLNAIKMNGFTAGGKYSIQAVLANDSVILKDHVYILENGFIHQFFIDSSQLKLKKIIPDDFQSSSNYIVFTLGVKPKESSIIDSLQTDTTEQYAEHYQLEGYSGKIGCAYPVREEDFNAFKINLKQIKLEDEKLSYSKEAMVGKCILSRQLVDVLALLEYEETKLSFTEAVLPFIFDLDNFLLAIKNSFKFESSIDKITQQFQSKK